MRKSRFSETEIVYAVKQVEAGIPVGDVARKYGVSQKTIYLWRTRFGGLSASEVARLKQLEDENRKLKQMVAELSLDKHMLQDVLRKTPETGGAAECGASVGRDLPGERAAGLSHPGVAAEYPALSTPTGSGRALRSRLRELAMSRPRYGYRCLWLLLRRDGWPVNHKRVLRLYREEGLEVRTKRRRKLTARLRVLPPLPERTDEHGASTS